MTTHHPMLASGWLSFAGIILLVVGVFNLIDGVVALSRHDYYLATTHEILVFNFTAWGWIWLILGIVQLVVGIGVLMERMWARIIGVVLAVLAAIGHILFLRAFPVWSVIVIAMCVLLVYALTTPPTHSRAA